MPRFQHVLNNLAVYVTVASLPSLVISYLAWTRLPGRRRTVILFIAVPIAIVAYAADVSDRLGWINLSNRGAVVQRWGIADSQGGGVFWMIVNSGPLVKYEDNYKMMLVVVSLYGNIDTITDTNIEKSSSFSITGGITNISIPFQFGTLHLRISQPPNIRLGDERRVSVGLSLVIIPKDLSVEQFRSLSDVQRLGGKIIAMPSTDLIFH